MCQFSGLCNSARCFVPTINTAKGFTGQYNDGLTGLDYYNARYYDPVAGVFLSADTAQGNGQGMNPYAYVQGNPETYSDPTGRYIGTVTPITQKGGAMAYINPATGASMTIVNDGYSVTSVDGQPTSNRSGLDVTIYTYGPTDPSNANYDPNTDWNNSPWAKFSRDIGLTGLQQTWGDPNATWLDKLLAVGKFVGTNVNSAFQLALILGVPEGEGTAAAGEEGSSLLSKFAEGCGALSFAPTTPVATAHGEQAIGKLHIGDKVWAYNPKTRNMELEPVLHVWINHDNDLVDLTLMSRTHLPHSGVVTHKSEVIHTNKKHPFLTLEKGFLTVGQIKLGMHVLRADGTYGVVTGWKVMPGIKAMYNLEVAQDHTFTVGTGQWVVHNHCGPGGDGLGFGDQNLLNIHFGKHNLEFSPSFADPAAYENAAVDFMTQAERSGLHEGIRWSDGSILRVDESTGWFGVMRNGKINTFFIPNPATNGGFSPVEYFLKQIDDLFY